MRTKKGIVTSAKMKGTVSVTVHRSIFHPVYQKRYRRSKTFLADSGTYVLNEGDAVIIGECRPLSKRKYFRVIDVLKKSSQTDDFQEEEGISPSKS
jgi:small subunit ribosomal protein S17